MNHPSGHTPGSSRVAGAALELVDQKGQSYRSRFEQGQRKPPLAEELSPSALAAHRRGSTERFGGTAHHPSPLPSTRFDPDFQNHYRRVPFHGCGPPGRDPGTRNERGRLAMNLLAHLRQRLAGLILPFPAGFSDAHTRAQYSLLFPDDHGPPSDR